MKKKSSAIDEFLSLSDREKELSTTEFDKEFIGDSFGPLTARQRSAWTRAKRRLHRSDEAKARRVSIALPPELLNKSDSYAKKLGVSRSELVKRGLRAVLAGKA